MPIITFVNNKKEETGKTMSLVAIATNMAIEYNTRILVISTTNAEDKIKNAFIDVKQKNNLITKILGNGTSNAVDLESGIEGLAKLSRSNRITPKVIPDYTNIIFKNRLELLLGCKGHELKEYEVVGEYTKIIMAANQSYDKVFVDLDYNVNETVRKEILNISDVIVINTSQRLISLQEIKEENIQNQHLKSNKTIVLMGKYDQYSKYNFKNITRFLGEKQTVLTIPYNTLFFEACEEAKVVDLFLKLKKIKEETDRNYLFMQEVNRATETILEKLKEVQSSK